jgi:RsiW-degrading membrane proteinase PrsW (M82 family)
MDENTQVVEQPEMIDIKTYRIANKRSHFKKHIAIYFLLMIVLWVLYFFIFREPKGEPMGLFLKSLLFVTIIWTVLLFFHYLFVYRLNATMVDREIKKLQKEIKNKKMQLEKLKEEARQLANPDKTDNPINEE